MIKLLLCLLTLAACSKHHCDISFRTSVDSVRVDSVLIATKPNDSAASMTIFYSNGTTATTTFNAITP